MQKNSSYVSWHAFSTRGHVAHNVLLLNQRPVKLFEHVKIMKENAENEGRGTRVFIYLLRPGCARCSSALLHPSARSLCRPGGFCFSQARRALLLTSPSVFGHPACKPRLSWRRRSPQIEAPRSGFDSERRSPAAQSKNRQAPKAIAGSEPCAGCSDEPQKV